MDLEELKRKRMDLRERSNRTLDNMKTIANESKRVAAVAHNARAILDNLEQEFERQTKLNKVDIGFLFFATALQCIRQYWLSNEKFRFKDEQQATRTIKKYAPISLTGPVPYDAFKKEGFEDNTGISGYNHRYTTLGHDPLLGWIFGIANILTETVTKNNFLLESYDTVLVGNEYKISGPSKFRCLYNYGIAHTGYQ